MSEYIITCDEETASWIGNDVEAMRPLVRCRDCYYADEFEGGYWCERFGGGKEHVSPNGFCAWGVRR